MRPNGVPELTADRQSRVQRGQRILEDHADFAAAQQVYLMNAGLDSGSGREMSHARW